MLHRSRCSTKPRREEAWLATRGLLQMTLLWVLSPNPQPAFRVKTLESKLDETILWIPTDTQALSTCSLEGLTLASINCKKNVHQTGHACGNLNFNSFGLNQLKCGLPFAYWKALIRKYWTSYSVLVHKIPKLSNLGHSIGKTSMATLFIVCFFIFG